MTAWNKTYDFVVIGSGAGSMVAGMIMRRAGKSVLILEKDPLVGGTTARSGGIMWIPNNPVMKADGVQDSHDKALTYLNAVVGDPEDSPGSTLQRRSTFVSEAPKMVEFLVEQGLKFRRIKSWPDYFDELPGGIAVGRTLSVDLFDINKLGPWKDKLRPGFSTIPMRMEEGLRVLGRAGPWAAKLAMLTIGLRITLARITGKQLINCGRALQGRLLQAALREGVEFQLSAPVKELVLEDGAVKGVLAEIEGEPVRIRARLGVLLNAGGFGHNQSMRDQYMPGTSEGWSLTSPTDTGEMIQEAVRIGAVTAQMDSTAGAQLTIPPDNTGDFLPQMQMNIAKPHAMLVDQTGVRYQNEGGSYSTFTRNMMNRHKVAPAVPSWMILDSDYTRQYMLAGTLPGSPQREKWVRSGFLRKGDTIEALAKACDIDPAVLKQTVERFNGFARNGRDEDFGRGDRVYDRWLGDASHRPSPALGTIAKAPFYALPIYPGDVGTLGGVVTDERARVLREDGKAIPGLYATGASTASVMGSSYAGAGSSIGPTMTWGYVAAKDALSSNN